jgi:hypothetical protein
MKVKDYVERLQSELSNSKAMVDSSTQTVPESSTVWQEMLAVLADSAANANSRQEALNILRAGSFSRKEFAPFAPRFRNALGQIAEDPAAPQALRHGALDALVNMKDQVARTVLIDGLKNPAKAAVAPAAALEMLARDDHASAAGLAREALDSSNEEAVRQQAVRILGADPSAKDRLREILRDKNEFREVRRAGAVALRGLDPGEFESDAAAILDDPEDFPEIKSTLEGALSRSRAAAGHE